MASASKHLRYGLRHYESACRIGDAKEFGWACVALFYSAHQLVHTIFDVDPGLRAEMRHPESHADPDLMSPGTNVVVKRHYRQVSVPYIDLFGTSTGIRYNGQVADESIWHDQLNNYKLIQQWTKQYLSAAGRDMPEWLN